MTDKKREDETTPIKTLPKCASCGKILLHCKCGEKELKK